MNKKLMILVAAVIGVAAVGLFLIKNNRTSSDKRNTPPPVSQSRISNPSPASQVPAHYEIAPPSTELRPVLPAAQFAGKTRDAYEAAKEIPVLLAQMPCYCHCDRGMGHKSLHSCFEDDHAAHCATCVDEALMTYELKKQGLSAKQIRDKIIAEFAD